MSYRLQPGARYRMPTHFGPAPGPRQRLDDSRWRGRPSPLQTTLWADFAASAGQLEPLLPECFEPDGPPRLRVRFRYLSRIAWLAGRGYNILDLAVPVVHRPAGGGEAVRGDLVLVLWESLADPIVTGREDLGYAKLYAEIPPARGAAEDGHLAAQASWDGFTFAELTMDGIGPPQPPGSGDADAALLHLRYLPETGAGAGAAVSEVTVTPPAYPERKVLDRRAGTTARVRFHAGDFDRLPTLFHITGRLAELDLAAATACGSVTTLGGKDLSDQYTLR